MAAQLQIAGREFNCIAIPLTQGKYSLIDLQDFPLISRFKWHLRLAGGGKIYASTNRHGRRHLSMHRLLMGLPTCHVDHANGDGLDNRRFNLRRATPGQNAANRGKCRNNTSGYKGVYFQKTSRKFIAAIQFENKLRHLGLFTDPIDAAKAYDVAALEFFGQFAKTNFEVTA